MSTYFCSTGFMLQVNTCRLPQSMLHFACISSAPTSNKAQAVLMRLAMEFSFFDGGKYLGLLLPRDIDLRMYLPALVDLVSVSPSAASSCLSPLV
ncbi:hypothetical protein HRR83_000940 [Exophiala dermatitidis]|uniref:Uncharacterized protein n=1 Tax=Exophiala dermatitidis TaxID=5970 RepID=A0AAN6F4J0_EXODE|nr:hypothetical protein HRR74_000944 [Exophiala dermatitidis]KAJ4528822.1 hypothetical protein HRR73_001445 [Exophiala dermatitidis]KAJ4530211.1 hypothetical protein HRR76_009441 [Exophiala dermatitidis]KAJ4558978.1 hypothetical protein HRR77_000943 [Exophiala dermatitidis]KAJ4581001.1 hypothetical protein HRR79_000056 [Exophiala dermatitidis]